MRLRLAVLVSSAALAATALPGHAAGPQISGDGGDVPVPNLDIVSAQFSTKGTTAKVGKKTVYTPKTLVVTVTYSGDPAAVPVAAQYVGFSTASCGNVLLQRYDGDATYSTADCVDDLFFEAVATGSTVVFTMPFSSIGKSFKAGTTLSDLRVLTGVVEPLAGIGPVDLDEATAVDEASTDASYRVA